MKCEFIEECVKGFTYTRIAKICNEKAEKWKKES